MSRPRSRWLAFFARLLIGILLAFAGCTSDSGSPNETRTSLPNENQSTPSSDQAVMVPDLTGLTPEDAANLLESNSLTLATVSLEEGEEEPGTILDQDPAPGVPVAHGEGVDIVVVRGDK